MKIKSGGQALLDRKKRDIASAGWVLHENETKVSLASFYEFVLDHFDIELSYATSHYLYEDGFAPRVVQKKAKSFVVDLDAL